MTYGDTGTCIAQPGILLPGWCVRVVELQPGVIIQSMTVVTTGGGARPASSLHASFHLSAQETAMRADFYIANIVEARILIASSVDPHRTQTVTIKKSGEARIG